MNSLDINFCMKDFLELILFQLFDAKHLVDTIGEGPVAINKKRKTIKNLMVCRLLETEVHLYLVCSF